MKKAGVSAPVFFHSPAPAPKVTHRRGPPGLTDNDRPAPNDMSRLIADILVGDARAAVKSMSVFRISADDGSRQHAAVNIAE
jgi:hypothetical protein